MSQPDPIQYWNGPAGARWVSAQTELDQVLAPFGEALLARARPAAGERVVDVGCGCGATTLALAEAVAPGGAVVGLDVSAPMISRARERAEGVLGVTFVEGDAAAYRLSPPADLLFSRFGVMFFERPEAAFANLLGLLRPSGRIAFVCWRALTDNPWAFVPYEAARISIGAPAAPLDAEGPGPFAFADPARVRRLLSGAGFEAIAVDPIDHEVVLGRGVDEAVAFTFVGGPAARLCAGVDPEVRPRVEGALREALTAHERDGRVSLGGAAWLVTAHRGG